MKKPGAPPEKVRAGKSSRKAGHLSETDHLLWKHTASSLMPLKRSKGRVHAALEDQPPVVEPNFAKTAKPDGAARPKVLGQTQVAAPAVKPPSTSAPFRKSPPLADFDQSRARKLRTGRVEIDARIDLHGLRQSEAHVALRGFLHSSHNKGHRVVLVITGKGAQGQTGSSDHWTESMGRSERGILRRNVPMWLSEPELRAIVVSFTTAAIRHGGEGALYVHLRRLR